MREIPLAERNAIKNKIEAAIDEAQKALSQLEDLTKPIGPENSIGRVSRMDAIHAKGVSDAACRQKERQLTKLKIALERIDRPSFGICVHCQKQIQIKRLMYMPESDHCVRCADK